MLKFFGTLESKYYPKLRILGTMIISLPEDTNLNKGSKILTECVISYTGMYPAYHHYKNYDNGEVKHKRFINLEILCSDLDEMTFEARYTLENPEDHGSVIFQLN